jgi:hypothetical protein
MDQKNCSTKLEKKTQALYFRVGVSPVTSTGPVTSIMKHKVCKVCCTTSTPQWRKDLSDGFYFCNACGIKFLKNRRKNKQISLHILLPGSIHKSLEDSEEAFQSLKNLIK